MTHMPSAGPPSGDVSLLARLVAETPADSITPPAVHGFRRAFIDYLACTLAGSDLPVTRMVRDWALAEQSRPVATVIGSAVRLSATEAALVNGAAAHGLDFDDGQTRASAHPGGVIFSAALAEAERSGAGMGTLIEAAVLGYEVMLRIAAAMHPASARLGWHNTAVAGVFGAAAAAARIRGLDAQVTRNALGIAASFAGGVRQFLHDGAEVKRLHPGKAARDGLVCAGLAAQGITGPAEALTGPHGLLRAMVEDRADPGQLVRRLEDGFLIETAYFKPYPCCRHYHAAIDAALHLRREHRLQPDRIAAIEIGLYSVGAIGHDHITARNLLEAQMSAPCAIAQALIHGRLGKGEFEPEAFEGEEVQRLLRATSVHVDAECERIYPGRRSGLTRLTLDDGRVVERRVLDPRGEGDNPLADADLSEKFLGNVGAALAPRRAQQLLALLWAADAGADLRPVLALLGGGADHG